MVQSTGCPSRGQGGDGAGPNGAGNLSNVKGVGAGVFECRIDFGPGYRVYFGKEGDTLIILLGGGIKRRQPRDMEIAHMLWREYRRRRRRET